MNIVIPEAVGVTGKPKLAVAFAMPTATVKMRVSTRWTVVSTPLAAVEVVTGTNSVVVAVDSAAAEEMRLSPGLSVTVWTSTAATAPTNALSLAIAAAETAEAAAEEATEEAAAVVEAVVEAATAPGTKTAGVALTDAVYDVIAAVFGMVTVTVPSAQAVQAFVTVVMGIVGTEAVVAPWAVQPQ